MKRQASARILAFAAALWAGFLGIVALDAQAADEDAGPLLVVVAPWSGDAVQLVADADGVITGSGWGGLSATVFSTHPGFARRLRDAGALAVFYPPGLVACVALGLSQG